MLHFRYLTSRSTINHFFDIVQNKKYKNYYDNCLFKYLHIDTDYIICILNIILILSGEHGE